MATVDPSSILALLARARVQLDALEAEARAILGAAPSPALPPVGSAPAGAPGEGEGHFEGGVRAGQPGSPPPLARSTAAPRPVRRGV